ncbi:N-6 DNA methylase [Flagellimonas ruestringensis]|nr:N-6 DNA methylase [Allomuricauda ruestringensis]
MNKSDYSRKELIGRIGNHIWQCASVIRNTRSNTNLYLLLYILSAYKDGVLNFSPRNYSDWSFNLKNEDENLFYRDIQKIFHPLFESLHERQIEEILHIINGIDLEQLIDNFKEVFEFVLNKIIDFDRKYSNVSINPEEISKLIIGLADLPKFSNVYNPFAGFASFGVYLEEGHMYYGQEINPNTWAIGQLRLKAHLNCFTHRYSLADSIENWNDFQDFDLIVASPPMRLQLKKHQSHNSIYTNHRTIEGFLVEKGMETLRYSNNGQLIVVFPLSFLFSGGAEGKLKKRLVDKNLIDTIITLPSGLLSNTVIPICVIVFKNHIKRPGFVKMIDGSSFYYKDNPKTKTLKYKDLLMLIKDDVETEFLRYVSIKEIYENDFDLSVSRYFLEDLVGSKLTSFAQIIRGTRAPMNESFKQVQIRDLKDDVFDSVLRSIELDSKIVKRGTFRIISESCLLIANKWNTLKPTYFKFTGESIAISQNITALKLNEDIVHPIYLINEFSSEYVENQVDSYRVGSVQPMLRTKDLKNIVFRIPDMKEQVAKVSGIIELSERLKKIESEKESLLTGIKKVETESSTSLSHILGKPLLSIGSSLEIIKNALTKIDPKWEKHYLSQSREFTLSDAFESISKNVKYIQELADRNTSMVSVSNFELEPIHFLKFLSSFVKDEKKSLKTNISLELDIHEDIKNQMSNQVIINGNIQKLRILLLNLLDNAKNHAFNENDIAHKINIEILPFTGNAKEASILNYDIDDKKSYVEVRVSNTGKSFPKDFKLEDYVRKNFAAGSTGNNGLGGYEVNEILKTLNSGKNALNIISNIPDSEYCTVVSFILPII